MVQIINMAAEEIGASKKEEGEGGLLTQCYNILNCMVTRQWNGESEKQYQEAYITRQNRIGAI